MNVDPALTSTENTALAGASTIRRFLSVVPLTVIGTADISATVSTLNVTEFSINNLSTNFTTLVKPGMDVIIKRGTAVIWYYRVRATPTSSLLYVMETATGDPGIVPRSTYYSTPQVGDDVIVYDRESVWSVLPRIDYPGTGLTANIYEDYNTSVGTSNTTPPPVVNITARGVNQKYRSGGHYSTLQDSGASTAQVSWTAEVLKWYPSSNGSSSLTYAWSHTGTWTGETGAATATFSATIPVGFHVLKLVVTDSIGGVTECTRYVWVHDEGTGATNPPIYIPEISSDIEDRVGWKMSLSLYGSQLSGLPDGSMVNYWEVGTWNGTVPTDNTFATQSPGWVIRHVMNVPRPTLRDASIEIVGASYLLQLVRGFSQYFTRVTTPTNWQEFAPNVATLHFVVWWMMRHRYQNLLKLFNYTPFSTSNSTSLMNVFKVDTGTALSQLQSLADSYYKSNFGADREGNFWFRKHPSLTWSSERSAIAIRKTFTESNIKPPFSATRELRMKVGNVRGEAFTYVPPLALPTPYLSDAPSNAPGQGAGSSPMPSQIIENGQTDLNLLTGHFYAKENNPYPNITFTIPKNWPVIRPAQMTFCTVDVDAAYMANGQDLTLNVVPISVSRRHTLEGVEMSVTVEGETTGVSAQTVPVPVQTIIPYDPGYLPPSITPIPPGGDPPAPIINPPGATEIATKGKFGIYCDKVNGKVYRSYDVSSTTDDWDDVTPSGVTAVQMVTSDLATNYDTAAYALTNDGSNSVIYYTKDIAANTPIWTAGGTISGIYTNIETASGSDGYVWIYNPDGGISTQNYDFTVSDQGFSVKTGGTANYSAGNGWEDVYIPATQDGIYISSPTFSSRNVISITVNFNPTFAGTNPYVFIFERNSATLIASIAGSGTSYTFSINQTLTGFSVVADPYVGDNEDYAGYITSVSYTYDTGVSGTAVTKISSDYGATIAYTLSIGSSPGVGGFTIGKYSPVTLAASDQQVEIQTTLGGAYSNASGGGLASSDPICIEKPWFQIGSVSNTNNNTSPDYFFSSAALVGGEGLWKVVGGTATAITPTISGNKGFGVSTHCFSTWKGKHWVYVNSAGGTIYISTTLNAGTSWTHNALANANSVRCQRLSSTGAIWIAARGTSGVAYSDDYGITWILKAIPTGSAGYAEVWG